jgi:hypothetical protein
VYVLILVFSTLLLEKTTNVPRRYAKFIDALFLCGSVWSSSALVFVSAPRRLLIGPSRGVADAC